MSEDEADISWVVLTPSSARDNAICLDRKEEIQPWRRRVSNLMQIPSDIRGDGESGMGKAFLSQGVKCKLRSG